MNIGFISLENPYDRNNNGGIGTYTGIMAKALSDRGHNVYIFTVGETADYRIAKTNISIVFIKSIDTKYAYFLEMSYMFYRKVMYIHEKCGLDVVEAPEWLAQGYVISAERSIPVITHLHTPLYMLKKIAPQQVYYREEKIIFTLEEQQCKNSKLVTTPSIDLGRVLSSEWGIDSVYIPNPINVNTNNIKSDISNYILYLGRLEYRKGIINFAYAVKEFLGRNENAKVILCGRDTIYMKMSMKKFVQKTCSEYLDRIVFIEHATGEEKCRLICQAVAIVIPSIWENCSYVGLEAMSLGKTVIVSNIGGFIEMVNDRIDGYKFEVNDTQKMADLMYEISMGEIVDTGVAANNKMLANYSVEKIISQYEKLIFEIL